VRPISDKPPVPIIDVALESHRDLFVTIGRSDETWEPMVMIKQFCPLRKCVTAAEFCTIDEPTLDERMAEG
jgi:hypothetical protein